MVQLTDESIESLYEECFPFLVRIGTQQRGLAHDDAESVANDVFIDFLSKVDRVENHRGYLAGAMLNASRHHQRKYRPAPLPPKDHVVGDCEKTLQDHAIASQALAALTPRCQVALRLRFMDGNTVPEIARILCTSVKYAEKVVRDCLHQAQRRYAGKTP